MDSDKIATNNTDVGSGRPDERQLDLSGLDIDDLDISDFLDETLAQEGEAFSKVMAASCTTCECCCSCVLLAVAEAVAESTIESQFSRDQLLAIQSRDPGSVAAEGVGRRSRGEREWPALLRRVSAEMARNTDPTDPRMQELAQQWVELLRLFTGDNRDILETLNGLYRDNPQVARQFGVAPDISMIEYISKSIEASRRG
jgi:thiazolylpeptide-type bacteriocin precursor